MLNQQWHGTCFERFKNSRNRGRHEQVEALCQEHRSLTGKSTLRLSNCPSRQADPVLMVNFSALSTLHNRMPGQPVERINSMESKWMDRSEKSGTKQLISRYRKKFRIRENLDHYSEEDFRAAEKKFLKLCLIKGQC
jgi:hypothetical protein